MREFFGFGPVDTLGYTVVMSHPEKVAIDCISRPDLADGDDVVGPPRAENPS